MPMRGSVASAVIRCAIIVVGLAGSAVCLALGVAAAAHKLGMTERWAWSTDACVLIAGLAFLSVPIQASRRGWKVLPGGPVVNVFMWIGWPIYMVFALATLVRLLV